MNPKFFLNTVVCDVMKGSNSGGLNRIQLYKSPESKCKKEKKLPVCRDANECKAVFRIQWQGDVMKVPTEANRIEYNCKRVVPEKSITST